MVHHLDRFSNAQQKELILCFCVISRETNKLHIMYTLSAIAWSNLCIAAALASIGLASLYGLFRTREDHSVKTMLGGLRALLFCSCIKSLVAVSSSSSAGLLGDDHRIRFCRFGDSCSRYRLAGNVSKPHTFLP